MNGKHDVIDRAREARLLAHQLLFEDTQLDSISSRKSSRLSHITTSGSPPPDSSPIAAASTTSSLVAPASIALLAWLARHGTCRRELEVVLRLNHSRLV
jgi:hypothetical protein